MYLPDTFSSARTAAILSMLCSPPHALARGGYSHLDVASSRYIDELPHEIRQGIRRWEAVCGTPLAARASFARYVQGSGLRFISLHFQYLSCPKSESLCAGRGCLHQVYFSSGGAYRLVFSANVSDLTLRFADQIPIAEIDCQAFSLNCRRVLRWTGNRFVSQ